MKGSTVIPGLKYEDAPAAIEWLVKVFGFRKHAVHVGPNGTVAHAQLVHGEMGMVMLGSATNPNEHAELSAIPSEIGGRNTSSMYLMVVDCEPVYASAIAAEAKVVMDLRTMEYGGKSFAVADPEGYLWSVGEYDPWE